MISTEETRMSDVDVVVAGAGIWGCTVARRLAETGRRVLVLEKRPVVGGNCRCENRDGIEVHLYGSHIFHTAIPRVWDFVRRFTDFNGYQHKVLAHYRGKTYFLPLGLALINKFFGVELKPGEVSEFMRDPVRSAAIFDAFFRGYTSKQWGRPPEAIDPSIIKRVPVRNSYDINYFNDWWQGIPSEGYNRLFERMLDHPGISVECGCAFDLGSFAGDVDAVYYSGPIDALFGYRFGALPWRSLRFETEMLDVADYQGTTVVNYTEFEVPYTRIHEFKHYHPERKDVMAAARTVVMREFPKAWEPGDEPYYPIDDEASRALLKRYQDEVAKVNAGLPYRLVVGGRLGGYRYFDMDKSVNAALELEI